MPHECFTLSKELTFETVNTDLSNLLVVVKRSKSKKIILNLQNVTRCDSAGLVLLIEIKRCCYRQKKTLLIEDLPQSIVALAQFCGVSELLS